MPGIPPIGCLTAGRKVVTETSKTVEKTINHLPKEMPVPPNESKIIGLLHEGTPFYEALEQIQTTLSTKFNNFNNK